MIIYPFSRNSLQEQIGYPTHLGFETHKKEIFEQRNAILKNVLSNDESTFDSSNQTLNNAFNQTNEFSQNQSLYNSINDSLNHSDVHDETFVNITLNDNMNLEIDQQQENASQHTKSFQRQTRSLFKKNSNIMKSIKQVSYSLPLVPPVSKLYQHDIPHPLPISSVFHISWFQNINAPSVFDNLEQDTSLENSNSGMIQQIQSKEFLEGQSLIGEISDQPLPSFPPISGDRTINSPFRLDRNDLEQSPNPLHNFENRSLITESKSLFIDADTVLLDQSYLNQSYASTSYNFQNAWNEGNYTKHTNKSTNLGIRQKFTILTRNVALPHSTPDLNPILFSCLSELEEPKPLCWYENTDTMTDTHYFIEGDDLLFVFVDGSVNIHHPIVTNNENISNLDNTQTSIQSIYSQQSGNLPVMLLVTYNERILVHELYILDYIREKQENLTGDLYFKKLDKLEAIFDGQKAEKVLIIQKTKNGNQELRYSSRYIIYLLVNGVIVAYSIDLEYNGRNTFIFKIPDIISMEMLRYNDGREALIALQYRENRNGQKTLHLSIYNEKFCIGTFSLQDSLMKLNANIWNNQNDSLNNQNNISNLILSEVFQENLKNEYKITLDSVGNNKLGEKRYSSETVQLSILLNIQKKSNTNNSIQFFIALQDLPPQSQIMQDIFSVLRNILPQELSSSLQYDFIWLKLLFQEDSENLFKSGKMNLNTQKNEIEIFFILCCINIMQSHLVFTFQDSTEENDIYKQVRNRLLNSDSNIFTPISISSEYDLENLKKHLKTLQITNETSQFEDYINIILLGLHLLSESYRINSTVTQSEQSYIVSLIILFSRYLHKERYIIYYSCLYPDLMNTEIFKNVRPKDNISPKEWNQSIYFGEQNIQFFNQDMLLTPPSLFKFLSNIFKKQDISLYPFILNCFPLEITRKICRLFWNAFGLSYSSLWGNNEETFQFQKDLYSSKKKADRIVNSTFLSLPEHERLILTMDHEQLGLSILQHIGFGLASIIHDSIVECKKSPKNYWPASVFSLIGRKDISHLMHYSNNESNVEEITLTTVPSENVKSNETFIDTETWCYYDFSDDNIEKYDDELEHQKQLLRFLPKNGYGRGIGYEVFEDKRLDQVWALLSSSCALRQYITTCCTHSIQSLLPTATNPSSEVDQLQLQNQIKKQLVVQIVSRLIGRGILTFSTRTINTTENIEIPQIVLKVALKRSQIQIDLSDQLQDVKLYSGISEIQTQNVQNDPLMWPSFHNGTSQALSIVGCNNSDTHIQQITREWIIFHSPPKPTNEHAGLLLALGIQGHLNVLDLTDIYHCLRTQHELTSIAVLLGLSASKISSQDAGTTRTLSMHIPSLTSNSEIEIPSNIQSTSLLGLGLLYSGSSHRFISEVLFNELIRSPSDSSTNREGYALAAGFALGLCTLGQGTKRGPPLQLVDLNLDDKLHIYMIGGLRPSQKESGLFFNSQHSNYQCTKVLESPYVINVDVTGPGACVALSLMYIRSHNKSIMQKLKVPDSQYSLEYIRPEMILLRIVGMNLVGWDWIEANELWITKNIPQACRICHDSIIEGEEWIRTLYCYALAGCCFTLGLRFAGSGRRDVYELIIQQMKKLESNKAPSEKATINHCIMVCILSLSCVMSGRGNVDLVNIILSKRKQLSSQYDFQMALNMALGINFLGGGRCSFGTTPLATASLLISLYPRFPYHFNDNQFHLQAFRHLYSLASTPRLLEARDIDTGKPCHIPVTISLKNNQTLDLKLPSIIPEKDEIESLALQTPAYYKLKIDSGMMNTVLSDLVLWVRHRSSYLPETFDRSRTNEEQNSNTHRSILYISPYESPQVLAQFLSTKPSLSRAVAYLSTKSDIIWQSLKEDNSNGIYLHEHVRNALNQLKKNHFDPDTLWNLYILIESKLQSIMKESQIDGGGYTKTLQKEVEKSNFESLPFVKEQDTYQNQNQLENLFNQFANDAINGRYWTEIRSTMIQSVSTIHEQFIHYIHCRTLHDRLKLIYDSRIGPFILLFGLQDVLPEDVTWNDLLLIRYQLPELPWELAFMFHNSLNTFK